MKQKITENIILNTNGFRVKNWNLISQLLQKVAKREKKRIGNLSITLLNDKQLLKINSEYLNHNTYTDIITFDLGDSEKELFGDIYISYEAVKRNASLFHVKQFDEFMRVCVHGLLHLTGYNDKSESEKQIMRLKEDYYLNLYTNIK